MTVLGQTADSAAAHLKDIRTYQRMNADAVFRFAPIKSMSVFPTVTLESLLAAQAALPPERVARYQVNWVNYFLACQETIEHIAAEGADATLLMELLSEALQQSSPQTRDALRGRHRQGARPSSIRTIAAPLLTVLRSLRRQSLDASALGLETIADCARYLASLRN
jgi:hypothetical protein